MATHENEETSESLKHKALVLKVPILCACEGCKKKVRRILYKVQGVHTVDVDIKQQKVTVIGDVKAEALIKKLAKHGKEAKVLQEDTDRKDKNPGEVKNREKQSNPETSKPSAVKGSSTGGEKDVKPPVKFVVEESAKKEGEVKGSGGEGKATKANGEITDGGAAVENAKSEGKKPETGPDGNIQKPAVEKKDTDKASTESDKDVEKKKTKGQKGKKAMNVEPSSGDVPAHTRSAHNDSGPPQTNHSPPRHQGYQYHQPPHFSAPPPVYAVSYNTAHPSNSNTASYYTQPPPNSYAYSHSDQVPQAPQSSYPYPYPHPQQNPYSYSHPQQMAQGPLVDYDAYHPRQPLDSFEMISDENPNGCLIM